MTASPPPEPSSRRPLGFDEFIAILVAFLTIGTILFWSIGRRDENLGVSSLLAPLADPEASPDSEQPPSFILPSSADDAEAEPESPAAAIVPEPEDAESGIAVIPRVDEEDETTVVPVPRGDGTFVVPVPVPAPDAAETPTSTESPSAAASPSSAQTPAFADVPTSFWAYPFIKVLAERNIVSGFEDGSYRPNQPITRAEFAALLQQAFTQSPEQRPPIRFTDVPATFWGATPINEAYQAGFLEGYPGGVFQPDQRIPRVQALAALARGLNLTTPTNADQILQGYQDADQIPNYAIDRVAAATEAGLVVNYPEASDLQPNREATRAEVAAFVYQALARTNRVEPIESPYVVQP